jgi:hypothetical protein
VLYREDWATREDAAFSRTAARAPVPPANIHALPLRGNARTTYHRPAPGEGGHVPFGPAAGEGAQSSIMFAAQRAGPSRGITCPSRPEHGS